jgi:hypothetical protein
MFNQPNRLSTKNNPSVNDRIDLTDTSSNHISDDICQIIVDEFKLELTENLFRFKNENLFTDIYIYVEGVEFACHKVVLCAASSYFKAMFSCDLKESRLGKVYIENILPWTMKRLLDFIYTGRIEINYENVVDIFNAAVMFQLYKLIDKCTMYIQEHIDLSNCVEINLFASMHNLNQLEHDTFKFMMENFMQLINSSEDFKRFLSKQQQAYELDSIEEKNIELVDENNFPDFVRLNEKTFVDLIKSDLLNVTREFYVYYAINTWFEYFLLVNNNKKPLQKSSKVAKNFQELYEGLLKSLRLNALTREELQFILKYDKYIQENQNLLTQLNNLLENSNESSSLSFLLANSSSNSLLNQTNSTINHGNNLSQSVNSATNLASATSKNNSENIFSVSSSGNHSRQATELILTNNLRPSTIPRDYFCYLNMNQFQYYDFYRSKWDTLDKRPYEQTINGYSVCVINNILYIIGGHLFNDRMPDHLDLVDTVYKFNPIRNQWSMCKPMLRKRAFHLSLPLTNSATILNEQVSNLKSNSYSTADTSSHQNYIFLFYGVCNPDETNEAFSISISQTQRLAQCTSIEYYTVETDQWSFLNISNSLLEHHVFLSINQYYRLTQTSTTGNQDLTDNNPSNPNNNAHGLEQEYDSILRQQLQQNQLDEQINNQNTTPNLSAPNMVLTNLINLQITQSKSIVSLKNLIYILKENCIHCYEFNATQSQLNCLPYFRLPINLNSFILAGAVSVKASKLCMSLFSWYSDSEENLINPNMVASFDSPIDSVGASSTSSEDLEQHFNVDLNDNELDNDYLDYLNQRRLLKNKKEALIYLMNPQQATIYEFYPARNKLKKLPDLNFKHLLNETTLVKIRSKLFVTGGINETESTSNIVECFDTQSNTWSVFSSSEVYQIERAHHEYEATANIPIVKKFLKLKMSLV